MEETIVNMKLLKHDKNVFIKTFVIVLLLTGLSVLFHSCQTQEVVPTAISVVKYFN